jgi:hypothetical protein
VSADRGLTGGAGMLEVGLDVATVREFLHSDHLKPVGRPSLETLRER